MTADPPGTAAPSRPGRPTVLRSLAERAAAHPRMEQAVVGAVVSAVRATLPAVIEALLAEEAGRGFGVVRLYRRKVPAEDRARRDERVRALLGTGMAAEQVAAQVGCSRSHVYRIRAALAGEPSQFRP